MRGKLMKKTFKLFSIVCIVLSVVLLSACGGSRYYTYSDTITKLESEDFTVEAYEDKEKINTELGKIVSAYNSYAEEQNQGNEELDNDYRLEMLSISEIKIEKMIFSGKDDERAYFFFCEDEQSAINIDQCLSALTNTYFAIDGPIIGGRDDSFVYLYSESVNSILCYAD